MNPAALFKIQGAWKTFVQNHPKFPLFLQALQGTPIAAGSVVEVKITNAEGKVLQTNVRLTESDLELIQTIKDLAKK